jgi:DNA-binding NtrC family response regulator
MTATAQFPPYTLRFADASAAAQPIVVAPRAPAVEADRATPLPATAPHVLHIDRDKAAAESLAMLLTPEARVTHVPTLAAARDLLQRQIFAAVVIDPELPDGDAADLLPALTAIPLLVYSASQPAWRARAGVYLPKPWTSPRQLFMTVSRLLGIPTPTVAGD